MADSKKEQDILKENLVGVYPTPFNLHFSVAHIKWYSDNPEDYISNLIGSQLLSSYTTDMSMLIRYINMAFFLGVIIYTTCSRKFKTEFTELRYIEL